MTFPIYSYRLKTQKILVADFPPWGMRHSVNYFAVCFYPLNKKETFCRLLEHYYVQTCFGVTSNAGTVHFYHKQGHEAGKLP